MANSKRIWNKEELTFAYYVSKYGTLNGLNMSKDEIVEYVIGDTTERSFDMQVANFNYILGLGDYQLDATSRLQVEIVEELKNKTVTQVRDILINYADSIDEVVNSRRTKKNNTVANENVAALNAQEVANFEAKMKMYKSLGRRLTPVKR